MRGDAGLTLTEMLVSLVLVGLLASALAGTGRIALRVNQQLTEDVRAIRDARLAMAWAQELERLPPGAVVPSVPPRFRARGLRVEIEAADGFAVVNDGDGEVRARARLRRQAPSDCVYDVTGRRCR